MNPSTDLKDAYKEALRMMAIVEDTQDELRRVSSNAETFVWASLPMTQVEFHMPRRLALSLIQTKLDTAKEGLASAERRVVELTR